MDEIEKAALEAGAKAILAPVTNVIADTIGVLGGDRLAALRARRQARRDAETEKMIHETRAVMRNRGVEPDPDTPPEYLEEILETAQDNSIPELRALFARLAAAAADPAKRSLYRREFVSIAKRLEPLDALLLDRINTSTEMMPNRVNNLASRLGRSPDEIENSFRALRALGLITENVGYSAVTPQPTPLGRQLLMVVGTLS